MKRFFLKTLEDALLTWVVLAIGITATSILYATLNVAGLSESTSLLIAFITLLGLIFLSLLLPPKSLFGLVRRTLRPIKVAIVNTPSNEKDAALTKDTTLIKDTALIAELLLSLFGIFGVGWLIGGETTIGIILLVCSFFYWLIMILGTLFTLGFGLLLLGPLAIGLITLNALKLNNKLARRSTQHVIMQSQSTQHEPKSDQKVTRPST